MRCAGVDVGAEKGFDVAVVAGRRLVAGPCRIESVGEVVRWLADQRPAVVAVDSPCRPAPRGELSRPAERALVRAGVCGIRYTPHRAALADHPYYAWIRHGLGLYPALRAAGGWEVIECFPTATWSRLGGSRGKRSRARWSGQVLDGLGLERLPARMNQDARDAIGAALTAALYAEGKTEAFGDIIVPTPGRPPGRPPPARRGARRRRR